MYELYLYPPVIDTYMPAFDINDGYCRIRFKLSEFNQAEDIKYVQMSVVNQATNLSALSSQKYPSQIKVDELNSDGNGYYIDLELSDMLAVNGKIIAGTGLTNITINATTYLDMTSKDLAFTYSQSRSGWTIAGQTSVINLSSYGITLTGTPADGDLITASVESSDSLLKANNYYKVQLRFCNTLTSDISLTPPQQLDSWIAENLNNFSEWSTVCLITGIKDYGLVVTNLSTGTEIEEDSTTTIDSDILNLMMKWSGEGDTLKSCQITVTKVSDGQIIYISDILYTDNYNNPNTIIHELPIKLNNGINYSISINYATQKLYENSFYGPIRVTMDESLVLAVDNFYAVEDEENGRIVLHVENSDEFNNILIIKRATEENNFSTWETVHRESINQDELNYAWADKTVESGVFYKYGIQEEDSDTGARSNLLILSNDEDEDLPVAVDYEHCYLTNDIAQFKVKFRPNVSSMKTTLSDTKIDTIGAQFPFIKRNAAIAYRTFPISGLISFIADLEEDNSNYATSIDPEELNMPSALNFGSMFKSKEELFGGETNVNLHNDFNTSHQISLKNDYIYERKFREAVAAYLYADDYKLFRSPTEGLIIVRLMDISFSPESTVSRLIWNFNATAYEMDKCSIANFDKYNIQAIESTSTEEV